MKILESPVQTIERAEDLKAIQMNVGILMKTLHNIFNSSRFYKEARMVSFLDRLLQLVTLKIKKRVTLAKALSEAAQGPRSAEAYLEQTMAAALQSVEKYEEGFFISELMKPQDSISRVEQALN